MGTSFAGARGGVAGSVPVSGAAASPGRRGHLALVPPYQAPRPTVAERLGVDGLRLTRRGRLVLVALAAALLAPFATWGSTAVADAPGTGAEVRVHAVQPGETLWGFAAELAGPGEDLRPVMDRIAELNDLPTGALRSGQVLLLPVE